MKFMSVGACLDVKAAHYAHASGAYGVVVQIKKTRRLFRPIHLLLLLPFIAMLWVGFYNRTEPRLWGIPFFYWYQLLWIPIGAVLIWPVYRSDQHHSDSDTQDPS